METVTLYEREIEAVEKAWAARERFSTTRDMADYEAWKDAADDLAFMICVRVVGARMRLAAEEAQP